MMPKSLQLDDWDIVWLLIVYSELAMETHEDKLRDIKR